MNRFIARVCIAALAFLLVLPQAIAQGYPGRPIRVIVASPPGNPSDLVMREAAQDLAPRLGQNIIVDNRAGASEIIAQEACAKAAPDGYTICLVSKDGMSYNPHLFSKLPYDPDRDYRPVARLYFLVDALAVTGSLPVSSVKELQALAVAKPGTLNFGTRTVGGNQDFFRRWLADRWKTDIVGVPYKGTNFIFNALLAGEIQMAQVSIGNVVGLVQGGKIKVLAIALSKRSRLMPDVPTIEEAGLEGAPTRSFWGIVVPAGTPDDIVKRLNAEFVWLSRESKYMEFMDNRYLEIAIGTPDEFGAFLRADREQIGQLFKKYNVPRQ